VLWQKGDWHEAHSPDGNVRYLKSGYCPTRLCAKVPRRDLPPAYTQLSYEFCEVREEGEEVILYVATTVHDKLLQAKLMEDLSAHEVIFMETARKTQCFSFGI